MEAGDDINDGEAIAVVPMRFCNRDVVLGLDEVPVASGGSELDALDNEAERTSSSRSAAAAVEEDPTAWTAVLMVSPEPTGAREADPKAADELPKPKPVVDNSVVAPGDLLLAALLLTEEDDTSGL